MAKNGNQTNPAFAGQNDPLRPSFREWIGLIMIGLSLGLLITLSIIGFCIIKQVEETADKFKDIQALFGLLLPLIGTWIGTVLAYYFSKENFVAANQSVNALVKQVMSPEEKLRELKVVDVMLKPEVFALKKVKDYDTFKGCAIKELIDYMDKTHSERLPVLEEKTLKFVFLIYRTTLERFIIGYSNHQITLNDKSTPDINLLTFQNMIDSTYQLIKDIIELNNKKPFLAISATLSEARQMMQDNTICQDIFITQTGNREEKVEGWITNNLIIEKSELFKKIT